MKKKKLGTNTNLIRGGLNRSQFNETSEALFLTSGFVAGFKLLNARVIGAANGRSIGTTIAKIMCTIM